MMVTMVKDRSDVSIGWYALSIHSIIIKKEKNIYT